MESDLKKLLEELTQRQREMLDALEKAAKQKKTVWDYLQPTLIVTLVGAFLTWNIQGQQTRVQQLQAVEKFMTHLTAGEDDVGRQEIATAAVATLISDKFATQLASRAASKGSSRVVDRFFSATQPSGESNFSTPPQSESVKSTEGWAYLGHYDTEAKTWGTMYFQLRANPPPNSLVNQTLTVDRSPLNVRRGMPSPDATFTPVVDVLRPSSAVKVLEVRPWQSTGFMWARVSYVRQGE